MKNEIQLLNEKFEQLFESNYLNFAEVAAMKNVMGVYIIYNPLNEIIYIGSTNKFHIRFGTDLKHESTHTLVNKLIKCESYGERKKVVDYLKNECKMKIQICDTKREAEALEHIAIYVLQPMLNK
jgi:predicted GIY-YIG superfamily endonuclease